MAVAERSTQTPLYEEVVQGYAFRGAMIAVGFLMTTVLSMAIMYRLREHPFEKILFVALAVISAFRLSVMFFCFFVIYPLRIIVDEQGLNLRFGKLSRKQTIPFSNITAIRRSRYNLLNYENPNRPLDFVDGAQVWNMCGKGVLEIEAQDTRRIIILSSRADQLASLLHEMTRIPVEDCR